MKLFFARYVLLQVLYSQTRSLTNVIQSLNLLLSKVHILFHLCEFHSFELHFFTRRINGFL